MNALVLMLMLCLQTQGRRDAWGRGDWSDNLTRRGGGDYVHHIGVSPNNISEIPAPLLRSSGMSEAGCRRGAR